MSANIQTSAQSMSESLGSLESTPLPMHKLYFELNNIDQWYAIMREARSQFGKNWRGQRGIRRKLERVAMWQISPMPVHVWFEVPDPKFGTWISIKHAVVQLGPPNK